MLLELSVMTVTYAAVAVTPHTLTTTHRQSITANHQSGGSDSGHMVLWEKMSDKQIQWFQCQW